MLGERGRKREAWHGLCQPPLMFIEADSTTGTSSRRGGGGTPLYKLYRYVPPHRVGFFRRFGLKTDIHSAHFGLESGIVFEGTTGVYEHFYRFNSK